jgi:hypothetical protein
MGDDEKEDDDDDHLLDLNDALEPLPDAWLSKWPRAHKWFGPNRERLNPRANEIEDMDEDFKNDITGLDKEVDQREDLANDDDISVGEFDNGSCMQSMLRQLNWDHLSVLLGLS